MSYYNLHLTCGTVWCAYSIQRQHAWSWLHSTTRHHQECLGDSVNSHLKKVCVCIYTSLACELIRDSSSGQLFEFIREKPDNEYFWEVKNESGEIGFVPSTHVIIKEQQVIAFVLKDFHHLMMCTLTLRGRAS